MCGVVEKGAYLGHEGQLRVALVRGHQELVPGAVQRQDGLLYHGGRHRHGTLVMFHREHVVPLLGRFLRQRLVQGTGCAPVLVLVVFDRQRRPVEHHRHVRHAPRLEHVQHVEAVVHVLGRVHPFRQLARAIVTPAVEPNVRVNRHLQPGVLFHVFPRRDRRQFLQQARDAHGRSDCGS